MDLGNLTDEMNKTDGSLFAMICIYIRSLYRGFRVTFLGLPSGNFGNMFSLASIQRITWLVFRSGRGGGVVKHK